MQLLWLESMEDQEVGGQKIKTTSSNSLLKWRKKGIAEHSYLLDRTGPLAHRLGVSFWDSKSPGMKPHPIVCKARKPLGKLPAEKTHPRVHQDGSQHLHFSANTSIRKVTKQITEAYFLAHFLLNPEKEATLVKSKYFARRKVGTSNERIIHGQPQWVFFQVKLWKCLLAGFKYKPRKFRFGVVVGLFGFCFLTFLLCRQKLGFSSW